MNPVFDLQSTANLAIAALVGLAVGVEREWSGHASGPSAQFAGVRTFLVLGLLGGVGGWFYGSGLPGLGLLLVGSGLGLTLAAYVLTARQGEEGIHGTTEAAALLVVALGAAAGVGQVKLAAAATAVTVLALYEKTRIHAWVQRIGSHELLAALQFAVLALVILPLLPVGPFGPLGGIRPRALWTVVLLFSGINFAGYIARRAVGEAAGYGLTGMLGGLVSSTVVSLTLSPLSKKEPELARPLGIGVLAACAVLLPRVVLLAFILNADVALALLRYLAPPFVVGVALVAWPFAREMRHRVKGSAPEPRNPLRLGSAIRMTLAFQVVLMAIHVVEGAFGSGGVVWSAAVVGLTDVDAITVAMARLGERPEMLGTAARAIAIAVLANTGLKLGVTVVLGAPAFRRVASVGLGLLAAASAGALVVWW
jgi:uncharacterized membrane protein (DUF4010 family)